MRYIFPISMALGSGILVIVLAATGHVILDYFNVYDHYVRFIVAPLGGVIVFIVMGAVIYLTVKRQPLSEPYEVRYRKFRRHILLLFVFMFVSAVLGIGGYILVERNLGNVYHWLSDAVFFAVFLGCGMVGWVAWMAKSYAR